MTVEVRPLNVLCNIQCGYCYQHPQRDAGSVRQSYDMSKIKNAIEQEGGPFTVFGGEPLLLPKQDLEDLWAWGYERYGRNSIQTNGTLITEDHVELFRKYKVRVGISIDGPGELNDARWHGTLARTRESTAKTLKAIELLCAENIIPSLIITLHRINASGNRLEVLTEWVRGLGELGVRNLRLHLLESEQSAVRTAYGLSTEENIAALMAFLKFSRQWPLLRIAPFPDMERLLLGVEGKSCTWNACDPYTTGAVRGIEGQGQRSNCGRTNKDGIDFVKAAEPGYERYLALYFTPQEHGGCSGCRFFAMCKGQCPGTAIDGDWRNRSEHCEVWKALYAELETILQEQGFMTLSVSPERSLIESRMLAHWMKGSKTSIRQACAETTKTMA